MTKTIAERLRERAGDKFACFVDNVANAVTGEVASCIGDCTECHREWFRRLADAIEAEQIADIFKPMPDGIEWPRFEDGELVRFGDEFLNTKGNTATVTRIALSEKHFTINKGQGRICKTYGNRIKRPEPEVLDADGVPSKVGDTVYDVRDGGAVEFQVSHIEDADMVCLNNAHQVYGYHLTHRKPDTQESIDADCMLDAKDYCEKHGIKAEHPKHYGKAKCEHLLQRQRKLLGGE